MSLSLTDDKGGLFYCHVCGAKGDKVSFVQQFLKCSFKEALSFFGLANGKAPKPTPEFLRRDRVRRAKRDFCKFHARRVGKVLFNLNVALSGAEKRLAADVDDEDAWFCLSVYHRLYPRFERLHGLLISRYESEQTAAYREIARNAA